MTDKNSVKDQIVDYFGGGKLFCAESVVKVIAEAGGNDTDDVIRMATGFCSGAARTCGQCGAVSGALMGIGLYAGRSEPEAEYEPAYSMTQEFLEKFNEKWGSINCYGLTECDFRTQEGQKRFKDEQLLDKCVEIAAFAAETALIILREHGYLAPEEDYVSSRLAPCGLMCGKCLAFAGGHIQTLSSDLQSQLGENFKEYAKRFAGMNPVFGKYGDFADLLNFLASGSCTGCRETGCLFKSCQVTNCVRDKGLDYCFQCGEFPCDHHGFPEGLEAVWRGNNEKMKESGVGDWFQSCKDKPRYP